MTTLKHFPVVKHWCHMTSRHNWTMLCLQRAYFHPPLWPVTFSCRKRNWHRQDDLRNLLLTTMVDTKDDSPFTLSAETWYWAVSRKSQLKRKQITQFVVACGHMSSILTGGATQCELKDYLLLDLQGVHVVIALGRVLLGTGLGINEHIVFVPWRQQKDSRFIFTVALRVCNCRGGGGGLWTETSLWLTHDRSASSASFCWCDSWKVGTSELGEMSYQVILGLGHPATVQCSFTVLPSQTVCPRGFTINSGRCVRLSGFIFLRNSDHSSSYVTREWSQTLRITGVFMKQWKTITQKKHVPSWSAAHARQIPWHALFWSSSSPLSRPQPRGPPWRTGSSWPRSWSPPPSPPPGPPSDPGPLHDYEGGRTNIFQHMKRQVSLSRVNVWLHSPGSKYRYDIADDFFVLVHRQVAAFGFQG